MFLVRIAALVAVVLAGPAAIAGSLEIGAAPISGFAIGAEQTRFGALEFVGGIELRSPDPDFGGLSGLRLIGDRFFAVSDTGRWFSGKIVRDAAGGPAAIADAQSGELPIATSGGKISKRNGDSEGLAIAGNDAYVSLERNHRVLRMRLKNGVPAGTAKRYSGSLKGYSLANNKGIEAIAIVPPGSPIGAELLAIAEESLDAEGNHRGFLMRASGVAEFSIRRDDGYAITDADFLPDGDLVILERSFSFNAGPSMRLRRIAAGEIAPAALVDGAVLMEADARHQIDNMEALAINQDDLGRVRITVASDDNFSALQRTLLLEFRLVE
jgi:hypothetical protein